jgi:chromosome segregation ATPase|nr:MAG TPA: minor tail protein [Caudoviricetes sp.]
MDNSSGGKDITLDTIAIEVESDSRVASNNIQQLAQELLSLKTATSGSFRNLNNLANYLNNLKDSSLGLSSVKTELKNLSSISTSLSSLTNLGKATNLKSLIKQLQQLPNLNEQLDPTVIDNFTQKIQKLSTALEPLANNLEKINTGLKSLPTSISKINNQTNQMSTKRGTNIFTVLTKGVSGILVKLQILGQNIQKVVSRTTEMISNASEYEEALNLFTVTLGSYAKEALSWITKFTDALHLDPSEVIQYMGSFNSLIKGLGVGSDKAYLMSKNLTQLVYDLASFKNLDIQTAFQKLQSAMSGEIEPLTLVAIICEYYRKRSEPSNDGCDNSKIIANGETLNLFINRQDNPVLL